MGLHLEAASMALADGWAPRLRESRLTAPAHGWPWAEVSTFQGDGPSGLSGPPGSVRGGTADEKRASNSSSAAAERSLDGAGLKNWNGSQGHRRRLTLHNFGPGWVPPLPFLP